MYQEITKQANIVVTELLEQAKGEKNLQRIRTYLLLLQEYSTYMTKANKKKTLMLLYELLMHRRPSRAFILCCRNRASVWLSSAVSTSTAPSSWSAPTPKPAAMRSST